MGPRWASYRVWPVGFVLLTATCGLSGCGRGSASWNKENPAKVASPQAPQAAPKVLTHDAGPVLPGVKLSHTFSFQNPLNEPIAVAGDADIRKDCGCATLELASRSLRPGESTAVTVTVDTAGRNGAVSQGGIIVWRTAAGEEVSVGFRVSGKVEPGITIDPPSLTFVRREVAQGVAKPFTVSSRLPIDWQTLSVTSSSPHAKLTMLPPGVASRGFSVQFSIPRGQADVGATLLVSARVREISPQAPGTRLSATAYALGEHPVALAWKPEVLGIRFDQSKESGKGQLMLWGEDMAAGARAIESVSCEAYRVEYTARPSAGDVTMLDLTFSGGLPERSTSQKTVVVRIAGGEPIRIPAVLTVKE